MAGMLVVGSLMYAMMHSFGHYYIQGVGYATIQDVLTGLRYPLYLLVLLFAAKLLGDLAYARFGRFRWRVLSRVVPGATSGAAWGVVLNHFFPALQISPAAFAVAGMGGVVGGSTGAAMAAIVMIFEMTLDYTVIIPMTLTVAISYGVRRSLIKDSIYTRKLTLRGESVPETMRADRSILPACGEYHASDGSTVVRRVGSRRRRRRRRTIRHGAGRRFLVGGHRQDARPRSLGRMGHIEERTIHACCRDRNDHAQRHSGYVSRRYGTVLANRLRGPLMAVQPKHRPKASPRRKFSVELGF